MLKTGSTYSNLWLKESDHWLAKFILERSKKEAEFFGLDLGTARTCSMERVSTSAFIQSTITI